MTRQSTTARVRRWFGRYRSRRVLGVWAILTVVLVVYVYVSVAHWSLLSPRVGPVLGWTITPVSVGGFGVVVSGGLLAFWSGRLLASFAVSVLIGVAVLSVALGCPGELCEGIERFRVFFEWTVLGPTISASTAPGECAYHCPHTVELLPLLLGYLLLGDTIRTGPHKSAHLD